MMSEVWWIRVSSQLPRWLELADRVAKVVQLSECYFLHSEVDFFWKTCKMKNEWYRAELTDMREWWRLDWISATHSMKPHTLLPTDDLCFTASPCKWGSSVIDLMVYWRKLWTRTYLSYLDLAWQTCSRLSQDALIRISQALLFQISWMS